MDQTALTNICSRINVVLVLVYDYCWINLLFIKDLLCFHINPASERDNIISCDTVTHMFPFYCTKILLINLVGWMLTHCRVKATNFEEHISHKFIYPCISSIHTISLHAQ